MGDFFSGGRFGFGLAGVEDDGWASFSAMGQTTLDTSRPKNPVLRIPSIQTSAPVPVGIGGAAVAQPPAPWVNPQEVGAPPIMYVYRDAPGLPVAPSGGSSAAWANVVNTGLQTIAAPLIQAKFGGGAGQPQNVGAGVTYYPPNAVDPAAGAGEAIGRGAGSFVTGVKNFVSENTGLVMLGGGALALWMLTPPGRRGRG